MATLTGLAACSLGLDPNRIGSGPAEDGGLDATTDVPVIPPPVDGGHDADAGHPIEAAECADAGDCVGSSPCQVGRCVAGECVFDVCPTTSCLGSTCTASGCTTPAAYGFHAATVHVGLGPVGCGGDATRCIAAAYPFVFVGTTNGVVAYLASDPSNASPKAVPVAGLAFVPSWVVASGSRVYFVGGLAGSGPTYKLPIAFVDVPSDPLATKLEAASVFDTYTEPQLGAVFPTGGGLLLVNLDGPHAFPVGRLLPPLKDADVISFTPSPGIASGAVPVAASGSRLVTARWASDSGSYDTYLSLETGVGTAGAQNAGEQNLFGSTGPTAPQSTFGAGPDGSVLWNVGSTVFDDAGTPVIRATRFSWVLADGVATTFDATMHAEVEQYAPPVAFGTAVAGPVAAVDTTQALVLAAAANQLAQTSVQLVVKGAPPAVAPANRRTVVPVAVGATGVATSGGFGYVLANDAPDTCTLHVFAPACAGP